MTTTMRRLAALLPTVLNGGICRMPAKRLRMDWTRTWLLLAPWMTTLVMVPLAKTVNDTSTGRTGVGPSAARVGCSQRWYKKGPTTFSA